VNKFTSEKAKELIKISIPPGQDYVGEEGKELEKILAKINKELEEQKEYFYKERSFFKTERLEKRIQEDLLTCEKWDFVLGLKITPHVIQGRDD